MQVNLEEWLAKMFCLSERQVKHKHFNFDLKNSNIAMQYNTYINNKTKGVSRLYVRLRGDKLQESENYSRLLEETSVKVGLTKEESASVGGKEGASVSDKKGAEIEYSSKHEQEEKSRRVFACLVQGNFALLKYNEPTPFGVEDVNKAMYLSVHDEEKMWLMDFPVHSASYGCVTIAGNKEDGIAAYPSNPEPKWVHCKRGDPLPEGAIYAGKTNADGDLYFGRVTSYSGIPCKVNVNDKKQCHNWWYTYHGEGSEKEGDILIDTGYQLVRAFRGDQMPANSILTGATNADNTLYVGRAGGNVPCKVNLSDGKIWNFWYSNRGENSSNSGEVLLLTNDHAY